MPPSMPRRFQFSLRALLVVLTVACLWFGWQVQRARRQRQAVEAIEAIGGIAQYDWQGDVESWQRIGRFRLVPSSASRGAMDPVRRALGEHLFQSVTSVVFAGSNGSYRRTGPTVTLAPSLRTRYMDADNRESQIENDIRAVTPFLRRLPYLRTIYLQERRSGPTPFAISHEAEEELRNALPTCRIVREDAATAIPEPTSPSE